jgi:hypothetical protein
MKIVGFDIYGRPGDAILEAMIRAGGPGFPVRIKPQPVGGYVRLKPR